MSGIEQVEIVVGGVEDDLVPVERLPDGFEMQVRKGVHQAFLARDGDLEKAELFRVGVQAVGLGIHSRPGRGMHPGGEVL